MRTGSMLCFLALGLVACPKRAPDSPDAPFVWEARVALGEVRVVPGLGVHDRIAVITDDYLGEGLSEGRMAVRTQRRDGLVALPEAVGLAMPGAINGVLGERWSGTFTAVGWPDAPRQRVQSAVQRGSGLDDALSEAARNIGGDAVLVTWVDALSGAPLSARAFPGDIVQTAKGSVVVDHSDEPYLVDISVGVALVAADGQVLLRYHEDVQTLLSKASPPDAAARDVAQQVAAELGKVWAVAPP